MSYTYKTYKYIYNIQYIQQNLLNSIKCLGCKYILKKSVFIYYLSHPIVLLAFDELVHLIRALNKTNNLHAIEIQIMAIINRLNVKSIQTKSKNNKILLSIYINNTIFFLINYQYLSFCAKNMKILPCKNDHKMLEFLTLSLLVATFVVCWLPMQTVWTQIRTDRIWIQTVWHSDCLP